MVLTPSCAALLSPSPPESRPAPVHGLPSSGPKPLLLLSRDSQSELSRLAQRPRPSSRAADPQAERGGCSGVGVRDEEADDEKRSQRLGMVRTDTKTFADELRVREGRRRCKTREEGYQPGVSLGAGPDSERQDAYR